MPYQNQDKACPLDVARGRALQVWRQQRGLTQDELAAHFGTTRQSISDWERGRYPMDDHNERMRSVLMDSGLPEGEMLLQRRLRLGVSATAVASHVGCSIDHVRDLELGRSRLRPGEREQFDAAFQRIHDSHVLERAVAERAWSWQQSLRSRRLDAGISAQRFARQLRVDASTLSKWECLASRIPANYVGIAERVLQTTTPDAQPARVPGGPYALACWAQAMRTRRTALGVSLRTLADMTSLGTSRLSGWERRQSRVPQRYAAQVDRVLERLEAEQRAHVDHRVGDLASPATSLPTTWESPSIEPGVAQARTTCQ